MGFAWMRAVEYDGESWSSPSTLKRAVAFIETRLFDELTLDGIAKSAATSRAGLVRAFKREMGKSPFAYVQARRLQEAASLLRVGRGIAAVAEMFGYRSASAFAHAYKRMYGKAPSEHGSGVRADVRGPRPP
jgi:AraC family transcriptional regulator